MTGALTPKLKFYPGRHWFVFGLMAVSLALLLVRAFQVQILESGNLQRQGEIRQLRTYPVKPVRGVIEDRQGEILAVSTPLDAITADPRELRKVQEDWPRLANALKMSVSQISSRLDRYAEKKFVYLRRHLPPQEADQIEKLGVRGVASQREYGRYYPAGSITGHIVGFTDVDDQGQEGVERSFDSHLSGVEGYKRVLIDARHRVVGDVESIRQVHHGRQLRLSLDLRIQAAARRHLRAAVQANQAAGGSAVMLDSRSGEVLAMVNMPDFNPNDRGDLSGERFRNRAVTDLFEPGSTIKPFTLSMALAKGVFSPDSKVMTSPGVHYVGGRPIRDIRDYGELSVAELLIRSSNVGTAKVAMELAPEELYNTLNAVGFGRLTGVELPGEQSGRLLKRERWRPVDHAWLSFGYGLSSTPLQLARAYSVLANGGLLRPVTIRMGNRTETGTRVLPADVVREINAILERVVTEGTAKRAAVPHYRVAGKTGTVHKIDPDGGYQKDRYQSLFAGFAPVSDPRLVLVVMIDDPRGDQHYGGEVAAPAFSGIMADALRLHAVVPDAPAKLTQDTARLGVPDSDA
ncbi:MAG: cell division protein [Proteobacteria bacterium]|nr:cell division protein [Pseudomonadota bacterium]MBP09695.1 cell division protein [Acidiferrobacteraceae bacterium]MDP6134885.1 penicillin-binding transpeptidase domain-containing protein [Arenicellales bacterium]HCF73557.1 cell division protein [Gammaproteobacteria bacterium]MDP6391624.1 penicillin-binding transpeptidase domain-containing protein [Arenicellales bacterium]